MLFSEISIVKSLVLPVLTSFLSACLLLFSCETTTQRQHLIRSQPTGDTLLISLSTQSGWSLDVYAAGDGLLCYGSKSRDTYHLPENTFEFDSVRFWLSKKLVAVDYQDPPALGVRITTATYPSGNFFALTDTALAEQLFQDALRKGVMAIGKQHKVQRLKKMYRVHPPVPEE